MRILLMFLTPGMIGMVAVFLSIVWMLRDERDKTRPLLVFALILNLFYGFLLTVVLGREDSLLPGKYDLILFQLDRSLGISAAAIALPLQGSWRIPLLFAYQAMVPMMIVWFLIARGIDRRQSIIVAYVAEMVAGPILYAILPACGPIYAFGAKWLHPVVAETKVIRFAGMPNAFPSLHIATALVFVLFARGRLWRGVSLAFLLATGMATLATGEHYCIDLVAGLMFGCFAASAGYRRVQPALFYFGVTLFWSLAVRLDYTMLIASPALLRSMAGATVALAGWRVIREWSRVASEPRGAFLEKDASLPGEACEDAFAVRQVKPG